MSQTGIAGIFAEIPMRRLWRALVLTAAAAGTLGAQGNTGTITGTVAKDNGPPLAGAQVLVVGTGLGTRTGEDGRFTIVNVPAGPYRLRAQMLGHRPVEHGITVVAGETLTRNFAMRTEAIGLDAVVITGTAGQARQPRRRVRAD